jgi:hypothetical protein
MNCLMNTRKKRLNSSLISIKKKQQQHGSSQTGN